MHNLVVIITDTQPTRLVGAYGSEWAQTPNLDRLAAEGIRFDRAYTPCPLCTPARGAMTTGLLPSVNGAWANEMSVGDCHLQMGTIMRELGHRAALVGKWHLDGAGYHGAGVAGGGFEPDFWHDGARYLEQTGHDRHRALVAALNGAADFSQGCTPAAAAAARAHDPAAALAALDCREEELWGHQVADRAIAFLESVGEQPFVLVVALDEPHGPFLTPPEWQRGFDAVPAPDNYRASLAGKPAMQQSQADEYPLGDWDDFLMWRQRHLRCNAWIDRQIGRVMDAVDRLHGDDTVLISTTDHGDMMGSHGLLSKGAMMYEECARIPFIARGPGLPQGARCQVPVSLVDILPTALDLAGHAVPEVLQGCSLTPLFANPATGQLPREAIQLQFNRFGIYHDGYAGFYPIRCATDGRWKLAINLFDRDELYDLDSDPGECTNLIDDPAAANERDRLHDWLLADMDRIQDPLRGEPWCRRPWRTVAPERRFYGREGRAGLGLPGTFAFDPRGGGSGSPQP